MTEGRQDDWERLATNLRVEKALIEVLELLRDFRVVVFKGGILTRQIYGDLRRRASADNDLWIEQPACHRALEVLLRAGYAPLSGLDARAAMKRYGQVALWPGGDMDAVSIDLHAEPFMGSLFSVSHDELQRHLIQVEIHGRSVTTFDRPLAFVHMVAHFLQHRLERDHLEEIGAAWDAWALDEEPLRRLARATCSEPALEHALFLCQRLSHCRQPVLERRSVRARICARLDAPESGQPSANRGRILSYLLAAPARFPAALVSGLVLEADDAASRYGDGSRLRLTWLRVHELLSRR